MNRKLNRLQDVIADQRAELQRCRRNGLDDRVVFAMLLESLTKLAELEGRPQQWWWLSFCDGDRFLGVAIVSAVDLISATRTAARLGINPGGQVRGSARRESVPERFRERLLQMADIAELKAATRPS